jgi:hypothetical protein
MTGPIPISLVIYLEEIVEEDIKNFEQETKHLKEKSPKILNVFCSFCFVYLLL